MFTFTQPAVDHQQQAAPAASIVSAVNYDRSPSLAGSFTSVATAEPDTPVEPREFESFAEAKAAFEAFLPGCNWPKPPTLKRFWYESEKHLNPGVDYVSWQFREHRLWMKGDGGEIQPRELPHSEAEQQAFKDKLEAAFDQVRPIEPGGKPSIIVTAPDGVDLNNLEAKHNAVVEAAAEGIASGVIESIETTDGETTITTKIEDGKPVETTVTEAAEAIEAGFQTPAAVATAAPPVRRKYSDEEYARMRKRAEEDFAIELQRKENQYAEISMERAKQEDHVKGLKAEEKARLESLRLFKADGPKYPKNPEIKEEPKPAAAGSNQEGGSSAAAGPVAASSGPAVPTASAASDLDCSDERYQRYCALPLLPIVKDIKGLGTNKLQTLIDQFPTVGKLLELQKEKGLQWFKAIGRGFGEELGSRIENAVGDALKKVE